jgi:hypothetical protein
MLRLLFIVQDTFFIEGRGLLPFPGIVPLEDERFYIGDQISLKRADGTEKICSIAGIEMIGCTPSQPHRPLVILFKELTKDDVPI